MKKRLRKKLHLGEFTEWGFMLDLSFDQTLEEQDKFWYFIISILEDFHLDAGGGGNLKSLSWFISKYKGTCTYADAIWLKHILSNQIKFKLNSITTSDLVDAWHGDSYKLSWPRPTNKPKKITSISEADLDTAFKSGINVQKLIIKYCY